MSSYEAVTLSVVDNRVLTCADRRSKSETTAVGVDPAATLLGSRHMPEIVDLRGFTIRTHFTQNKARDTGAECIDLAHDDAQKHKGHIPVTLRGRRPVVERSSVSVQYSHIVHNAQGHKRQASGSNQELSAKRQCTRQPSPASAGCAQGAANAVNIGVMHEFYPSAGNLDKASQPHGFMAERLGHFEDTVAGHICKHVGSNNAKDGADRIVNGVEIQTKYHFKPQKTYNDFLNKGELRYLNKDGLPMDWEVPADQHGDVVGQLQKAIASGKVKVNGKILTDPRLAKKLVRKGHYTYASAKAIVKPGTLQSVKYDVRTGAAASALAGGIAAVTTLATGDWKDGEGKQTCKRAAVAGGSGAARATGTHVATCQLARLKVPKAGAAAAVNVLVTVVGTGYDLSRGNISNLQAQRNMVNSAAGLAGGQAGFALGAAMGTAICPGVSTAVGGFIGATVAGVGAGFAADKASDGLLGMHDSVFVQDVYHKVVLELQSQYGLSESRVTQVRAKLETKAMSKLLINSRESAFYKALTAGRKILQRIELAKVP